MVEVASTLNTLRIGGQLDPAWSLDGNARAWSDVQVIAELYHPTETPPFLDPSNGAHIHPLAVANTIEAGTTEGLWVTAPLKPTTAVDVDEALQPVGLGWRITINTRRGNRWVCVAEHHVALTDDADLELTAFGDGVVDINSLLAPTTPGTSTQTVTAAEDISALRAVQLGQFGAFLYEPVVSNTGGLLGVSSTAATTGNTLTVVTIGTLSSPGAGLAGGGAHYWAGAGGVLTTVEPPTGIELYLGYSPDADTFVVQPGDPIVLI